MNKVLRESIIQSNDLRREEVDVPEWNLSDKIFIRELNGGERNDIEEIATKIFLNKDADEKDIEEHPLKFKMLIYTLCDANGDAIFSMDDVDILKKKNGKVIDRLFNKSMQVSGIREEDQEQEIKNSLSDQDAA